LLVRLDSPAEIPDLGCGRGVPMALGLRVAGHKVTGVDFSPIQIRCALRLVPDGQFICVDVTAAKFEASSFRAIVCPYTIILLPLNEQAPLVIRIASWLRPGGWLRLTAGDRSWTGPERRWLGGGAPIWWRHADRSTYRRWRGEAGLRVTVEREVREGEGSNAVFWAQRR
jgi:hypothetical protein